MLEIRRSIPGDAEYVAQHLREEDKLEVTSLGYTPWEAVVLSSRGSDVSYTALLDDTPIMVFGVNLPTAGDVGEIWALGTPLCRKVAMSMIHRTKEILKVFLDICPAMENWCDARYSASLRWLRLIGFEVGEPEPYGINGEEFCHISIRRK